MASGFDIDRCRTLVQQLAKQALEVCSMELKTALEAAETGSGQMRGTEEIFDKAFEGAADARGVLHKRRATADEAGVPIEVLRKKGTERGWIDCVLDINGRLIGIEHKVVRMPRRENNNANRALYDVGQISIDHYRLKRAKKLAGGYCTIILHGPIVRDAQSERAVRRHFHNMMFVDYSQSAKWGELKKKADEKQWQVSTIKELGFGDPYSHNRERYADFCTVNKVKTFAVVGLWASGAI